MRGAVLYGPRDIRFESGAQKYSCSSTRSPAPWDFSTHETLCKFYSKNPKKRNQCCETR